MFLMYCDAMMVSFLMLIRKGIIRNIDIINKFSIYYSVHLSENVILKWKEYCEYLLMDAENGASHHSFPFKLLTCCSIFILFH